MIQALHKAGHRRHHGCGLQPHLPPRERSEPRHAGILFRENEDGSYSDGSGCSNEFASERPMARRYLIDSVLYWAKEYHLDGFRFD